ncbi:MAG: CBS domain-containing protein [Chroococcales cyanobacterium]
MPTNGYPFQSLTLEPAIDSHFLTVSPDTPLVEVLALMSRSRSSCLLPSLPPETAAVHEWEADIETSNALAGCVLVVENQQLLGVFTERDIVSLTAQQIPLASVRVGDVMNSKVITLKYSEARDVFTALSLFRQYRIRHLPIVDENNCPIGIVTQQSIRRALRPVHLLTRLRYVRDVMTSEVIQSPLTTSVLELARQMTEHRVSCVVITAKASDYDTSIVFRETHPIAESLNQHIANHPNTIIPVGVVTERDIVQFQSLELDLAATKAQSVMSAPLFCLVPEDSLWYAHQTMSQYRVRRMVVVGPQAELLGIMSQTSLLQVLNPAEMYSLIDGLQEAVDERTIQLEQANEQLRQEIRERERAESELRQAHEQLIHVVEERTAQLREANAKLRADLEERHRVEAALRASESQFRVQANHLKKAMKKLQQTQLKLIQTEKMSSLGQLVAGIAHEINNPTNFIYGNLSYAEDYVKDFFELLDLYSQYYTYPPPEIREKIDEVDLDFLKVDLVKLLASMKSGAERIRNLVLSLRNFSRLDEAQVKAVNIHEGIDSTLLILQNRFRATNHSSGIEVIKDYGELPLVECYPGQLNQVFLNMISNAIDALESKEGLWKLEEDISSGEAEKSYHLVVTDYHGNESCPLMDDTSTSPKIWIQTRALPDKDAITIRIVDNGIGMTEETRMRLFDPFFTTKAVGKGTGLGLSISYQVIVEKHSGKIECFSQVDRGTEFVIEIPCQQAEFHKG